MIKLERDNSMIRIRYFILLTVLIFAFASKIGKAEAGGPTNIGGSINQPTVLTKDKSPYIAGDLYVYAPLEIEPGVVIKLEKYARIYINSSFKAIGTEDEKIVFTSIFDDTFSGDTNGDGDATSPYPGAWNRIQLAGSQEIILDHAVVHYGSIKGIIAGSIYVWNATNVTIKNSEIKHAGYFGLAIRNSAPTVENCFIAENGIGVYVYNYNGQMAVIRNNSIVNNGIGARIEGAVYSNAYNRLDARNNWWGDKSGPYYKHVNNSEAEDNLDGKGNPVRDGVIFRPWLTSDPLNKRKPVILVPGIGASINPDLMIGGVMKDNWQLFSHTYDGIIQAFKEMGYEEGKDFFVAYYDWRQKNEDSARNYLEPLIKKANDLNGTDKVNIIAHSMGGLVARSYIQSDDYGNDVDNLFLIGTPNRGASDVYPVWEGGYIPKYWDTKLVMVVYLNILKAKEKSLDNYKVIHNLIPSVKQLMPIYSYIYPKDNPQDIKNYSEMSEVNSWLENLNSGIQKLNDRVKVSVISGNSQGTVNGIPVINSDEKPLWTDGKPDPLDPERNDNQGDARVLLSSSQIQSLYNDILNYSHSDIVSQSEKIIAKRVSEKLDTIYPAPDIPSEMGFWFASPVDIEIRDPQSRIISGNANEIPLAKYAAESKLDGFKIVSIPNPIKGEYEIKITGNGNGEFHIGSEYMDYENGNNDDSSLLGGIIENNEARNYIVKYDPANPEHPLIPAFPKGLEAIIIYVNDQKQMGTIDSKEADFLLTKLKVIKQLAERANDKENVAANFREQTNRQIDWLINYISSKSDKKNKGIINEKAKSLLIESLNFIKFKQLTNI